jgi:hypothetical protein
MSELKVNSIVDANSGNTTQINGMTPTADSLQGFRNRILNGGMVIDQRNAGASVTVNSNVQFYSIDRWQGIGQATDGVFTLERSTVAPSGFQNSLLATVTTADTSIGATQSYIITQPIEGFNSADFAWGTSSASPVTLSFWVRSSVTGTFGGSLRNGDGTRSYPFSYSVSAANTWEYKTVTAAGDTTGTWGTDNGRGAMVFFSLGSGADRLGTAGAWNANNNQGAAGQTNLIATNGATWQVTGVQLEAGSVATPFERRPYGTELALCQRYYYKFVGQSSADIFGSGFNDSTTVGSVFTPFKTSMRVTPSGLQQSGTASDFSIQSIAGSVECASVPVFVSASLDGAWSRFTVGTGLTAGQGSFGRCRTSNNPFLAWSAEL